ncbi:glycerophosphodiester phosphodiesterase [Megalodesulfovibrio paquesii]
MAQLPPLPFRFGPVCAHRGGSAVAPENTLCAAAKGLALGADSWELDVQRTADGQLVVFHDDTLGRTTDVAARPEFASRAPWPVHHFTLAELQSLDAGGWFLQADPKGGIAAGAVPEADYPAIAAARIPTLKEALTWTKAQGFPVNVEIKDHAGQPGDDTVTAEVLEAIATAGCQELTLLSSFRHEYLIQARALCPALVPALPLAALVEDRHPDDLIPYLLRLGVAAYHPDDELTDAPLIRALHEAGLRVHIWTVNDPERARELLAAGADALITDWPQRMKALAETGA